MTMRPYCSRCMCEDPDPVKDDNGKDIFWFVIDKDDFGNIEIVTQGLDVYGDIVSMFQGITNKDFEYDDEIELLCPDCAIDYMEESDDIVIEDEN